VPRFGAAQNKRPAEFTTEPNEANTDRYRGHSGRACRSAEFSHQIRQINPWEPPTRRASNTSLDAPPLDANAAHDRSAHDRSAHYGASHYGASHYGASHYGASHDDGAHVVDRHRGRHRLQLWGVVRGGNSLGDNAHQRYDRVN
jgi:hypothetical protein